MIASRHDVEDDHELRKVNEPVIVFIVNSEDMFLHLWDIFVRQGFGHQVTKVSWLHFSIWVFCYEGVKHIDNLGFLQPTGLGQGGDVLLPEHRLPILRPHPVQQVQPVLWWVCYQL